jgi:hypothetical protein
MNTCIRTNIKLIIIHLNDYVRMRASDCICDASNAIAIKHTVIININIISQITDNGLRENWIIGLTSKHSLNLNLTFTQSGLASMDRGTVKSNNIA